MLEKVIKSLTILVFAIVGFLLAESAGSIVMEYATAKGLVGGLISSTVLNIVLIFVACCYSVLLVSCWLLLS